MKTMLDIYNEVMNDTKSIAAIADTQAEYVAERERIHREQARRGCTFAGLMPDEIADIRGLERLEFGDLTKGPRQVVYLLCYESRLMYVGQADVLWRRLIGHVTERRKYWDAVFFKRVRVRSSLTTHEMVAIRALRPVWNRQIPRVNTQRGLSHVLASWGPAIESKFLQAPDERTL